MNRPEDSKKPGDRLSEVLAKAGENLQVLAYRMRMGSALTWVLGDNMKAAQDILNDHSIEDLMKAQHGLLIMMDMLSSTVAMKKFKQDNGIKGDGDGDTGQATDSRGA